MRIPFYIATLTLAFMTVVSCGNKTTGASSSLQDSLDTTKQTPMFVWVENARVRESADLEGKVITELKAGDKVTLTGEMSSNKIKVTLRGVDFEDVWVKIRMSDDKEGWIFKPMLTEDENRATALNDFIIQPGSHVGRVKLDATKEDIVAIYGKEFIVDGNIYIGEGESVKGFYVFKNSPLELQCALNDQNKIFGIYIRQPGASWVTKEGVKIGTRLEDIQKYNGKPFKFNGFGWDFGGGVYDYNGGNLESYFGAMTITLGEPDNLEGLDEFMGDVECLSSARKLQGKGIRIVEMAVFGAPSI